MAGFGDLGLSKPVLASLEEMGFEEPTPVQSGHSRAAAGRDVVAQALTGTGKTAAFGIPLVERIDIKQASCPRPSSWPPPASWRCRWPSS